MSNSFNVQKFVLNEIISSKREEKEDDSGNGNNNNNNNNNKTFLQLRQYKSEEQNLESSGM
jgi:hypothetical protein